MLAPRGFVVCSMVLASGLAGCVLPDDPPRLAVLQDVDATHLSASVACTQRNTPFAISVTLVNRADAHGVVHLEVHAPQAGRLVAQDVELGPHEERAVSAPASLPDAGSWSLYVAGARAVAPQVTVRIVDPLAGGRC